MTDTVPSGPDLPGTLASGATFAGHRIESEIGRGGMGVVYRAQHLALDRARALKLIAPALSADAEFRVRFQRESRLAASIEHPNVIAVHHAGEENRLLYLSMRLVEGDDLRRIIEAEGALPVARAATLIAGVAAALEAAHARGLVHRDVKPANVLVERGDAGERVFLTDFGISRIAGPGGTLTSSGEVLGSVDYVAPEQIEGGLVDHRADIYALGCLLHFALTGQPPFQRDNDLAKLFAHANAPRPQPSEFEPELPRAIDRIVAKAMAVRPKDRYASAGELAEAAGDALGAPAAPRSAPDAAPTRRLRRPAPRHLPLAAGAVLAIAAIGVAAILMLTGGGGSGGGPASGPQPSPVATIKVGRKPTGLTVGRIGVWVASTGERALDAINPITNRPATGAIPLPGQPVSVAVGFGSIWVVDHSQDALLRVDPREGARPIRIPVGVRPTDVAVDDRWVWVSNGGSDTVSRVDPETDRVNANAPVGASPRSVATGDGAVWVANIDGKSVSKIDPQAARTVGNPVSVGQRPSDVAVGQGSVWAIDNFNGTLTRIDPDSLRVVQDSVKVGSHPRGVKTGFGYVWVANGGDDTVTRINPKSASPAGAPIQVGKDPADIAVGRRAVWTANSDDSTVTKIRP